MAYITNTHEFKFYPLCKPLKLTHMMFADDLLLFCKGDSYSMMTVLRTFAIFSKASGLNLSKGKSNAYFNRVPDSLKAEIMQVSGLVEGTFHLGRLTLIQSILKTLQNYWASIFILPNGVIARIESICKNFLGMEVLISEDLL
ncbi:uncharacterized protein LOC141649176 [Silene latifolia]|uniref:uncharacterized protein LOC141649176 n=1 Tax=Silene latifolia TaxID=37657 RepID=UPI003D78836B